MSDSNPKQTGHTPPPHTQKIQCEEEIEAAFSQLGTMLPANYEFPNCKCKPGAGSTRPEMPPAELISKIAEEIDHHFEKESKRWRGWPGWGTMRAKEVIQGVLQKNIPGLSRLLGAASVQQEPLSAEDFWKEWVERPNSIAMLLPTNPGKVVIAFAEAYRTKLQSQPAAPRTQGREWNAAIEKAAEMAAAVNVESEGGTRDRIVCAILDLKNSLAQARTQPAPPNWANIICGACQIMDAWKCDPSWTEWDTEIRQGLSGILASLYASAQFFTSLPEATNFKQHTEAVKEYLNELYAIMVDPLGSGEIKVADICKAIKESALSSREFEYKHQGCKLSPAATDEEK